MTSWKQKLQALKQKTYALFLASRDPRVPRPAKILIVIAVAYALSPIDLIPDFIPILGYVDDMLLLPLAIYLAIRMIPDEVWQECQQQAIQQIEISSLGKHAARVIIIIWLTLFVVLMIWLCPILFRSG